MRKTMGHYRKSFEETLSDITARAINESVEEIGKALEAWLGSTPQDWWKPDPEDPFWMLEVRQGFDGAGSWLKNEHSHLTTRDANKAVRYPNRFDAECARRRLYPDDGKFEPTEHSWIVPEEPSQGPPIKASA